MMQLVNSNGSVLLERERSHSKKVSNMTLRARRLTQGMKKTIQPVLMSKDEFFRKVIKNTDNGIV